MLGKNISVYHLPPIYVTEKNSIILAYMKPYGVAA